MPKAKPIDRVALTLRNSPLLQRAKSDDEKKAAFKEMMKNADNVPAAPGAIEHINEENFDGVHCPYCGAVMQRVAGCLECPNKCWSKCG